MLSNREGEGEEGDCGIAEGVAEVWDKGFGG